jgi:hypothetical protein
MMLTPFPESLGFRTGANIRHWQKVAEEEAEMRLSSRARALVQRCDELLNFADNDGIVCIPAVRAEPRADERLLEILQAVGQAFQPDVGHFGRQAGKPDLLPEDWLCNLFHNRPFIWHIWDGKTFTGDRVNDVHLTNAENQASRSGFPA